MGLGVKINGLRPFASQPLGRLDPNHSRDARLVQHVGHRPDGLLDEDLPTLVLVALLASKEVLQLNTTDEDVS